MGTLDTANQLDLYFCAPVNIGVGNTSAKWATFASQLLHRERRRDSHAFNKLRGVGGGVGGGGGGPISTPLISAFYCCAVPNVNDAQSLHGDSKEQGFVTIRGTWMTEISAHPPTRPKTKTVCAPLRD